MIKLLSILIHQTPKDSVLKGLFCSSNGKAKYQKFVGHYALGKKADKMMCNMNCDHTVNYKVVNWKRNSFKTWIIQRQKIIKLVLELNGPCNFYRLTLPYTPNKNLSENSKILYNVLG